MHCRLIKVNESSVQTLIFTSQSWSFEHKIITPTVYKHSQRNKVGKELVIYPYLSMLGLGADSDEMRQTNFF